MLRLHSCGSYCHSRVDFWTTSVSNGVWTTIMGFLIIGVNIFFVRVYGELGFSFSMLNIMLIIGLIITGLCIDLGGVAGQSLPGFQYWRNPGPLGQFLGLWTTLSNATYAYADIESIAATAAETESPRRNILKAEKRIRVLLFYVLSIFDVTIIMTSNSPFLLNDSGTAS
ncbi:amino acid permease/ SLC12A domain-containing protein, partial [Lentinula raphanica]